MKKLELKKVNKLMFNKLDRIQKTPTSEALKKWKPLFEFKSKIKDGGLTREQRLEIKAVNKYYKNKLKRQSSFYSLGQWNKEFEQSQHFKRNICEFPCIDFHRTKGSFAGEGINVNEIKKEYNNRIIDNAGNFFQKVKFKRIGLFSQKKEKRKESKTNEEIEKNE